MSAPKRIIPKHMIMLLAGFSLAAQSAERAAKAVPSSASAQPNLQFLEYLGTLEDDDENWTDVNEAVAVQENDSSANKISASKSAGNRAKDSKVRATADAETAKTVERK